MAAKTRSSARRAEKYSIPSKRERAPEEECGIPLDNFPSAGGRSKERQGSSRREKQSEKIPDDCWVQCDNPNCRKWRKIAKSAYQSLNSSSQWYCSMNADPLFSGCHFEEECYTSSEPYSYCLQCGELVWAKVAGWISWPAVISRDLEGDWRLEEEDEDRDKIYTYHVVFLGKQKSRAWVSDDKIEPYSGEGSKATKGGLGKGGGAQLTWARREAETILSSSSEERQKFCTNFFSQLAKGSAFKGTDPSVKLAVRAPLTSARKGPGRPKKIVQSDGVTPGRTEKTLSSFSSLKAVKSKTMPCSAGLPGPTPLSLYSVSSAGAKPRSGLQLTVPPFEICKHALESFTPVPILGSSHEEMEGVVPSSQSAGCLGYFEELQALEMETLSGMERVQKLLGSPWREPQDSSNDADDDDDPLAEESQAFTHSLADIDNLLAALN